MPLRNRTHRSQAKVKRAIASCWGPIESLEIRRLLSTSPSIDDIPQRADGWSVCTQTGGGGIVYVSSSMGDDSNNGTSPDTPVATLAKAKSMMRDGVDDW